MEKRRRKRFARRVQVRYWPRGDEHPRKGYTTNLSTTGVFIATNGPLPPGSRLRIEFLGESGFMVEAVVTHAARVATALQSIRSSGMGIRFLEISELIRDLLPARGEHETEEVTEAARRQADESALVEDGRFEELEEERIRKAAASPSARPATYTVSFRNVGYLLNAIESEITFGGVFVPTEKPARLQEEVRIALALPAPIKRTVHAEAIVVKVGDAPSEKGESTVKGMGVAFKDGPKVLAELERLIEGARPKHEDT